MADDDLDLGGVDSPRPLTPDLRARLEAVLMRAELPDGLRDDLEMAALRDLDGPRPMPPAAYTRVEAALLRRRRDRRAMALLGTAASIVLVLAIAALALRTGPTSTTLPPQAIPSPTFTIAEPVPTAPAPTPAPSTTPTPRPGNSQAPAAVAPPAPPYVGPAPPFTYGGNTAPRPAPAPAVRPPGREEPPPSPPATPAPLDVALHGGPGEAGFRAYVRLLNDQGGVRGRPIRLVTPGSRPAVATVNLATNPSATAARPLLETLVVPEDRLRGDVFGFASAAERQARLAVDEVYPEPAPGEVAYLYGDRAVEAYEEALAEKGVAPVRMQGTDLPPAADAVFLGLSTAEEHREWFRAAAEAGFAPARGVAGIAPLYDEALLPDLPEGTRILSPYAVPDNAETRTLRSRAGGLGAATVHGWVTAKALAVALWRTGADTPAEATRALRDLAGYETGFFPAYRTRSGTTSRVPDALLVAVSGGAFDTTGDFRTDPR